MRSCVSLQDSDLFVKLGWNIRYFDGFYNLGTLFRLEWLIWELSN
jgi:hypothetical protein